MTKNRVFGEPGLKALSQVESKDDVDKLFKDISVSSSITWKSILVIQKSLVIK